MAGREKNRGLIYLRRSDARQELSLSTQLNWALGEAERLGVNVEGDLNDLEYMQANRLTARKSLRLDDAVTGGDLSRPGFRAVNDEALRDRTISHVFFYKRDRFARPQETLEVALLE
ncbi:MAG TPA: recombinase family protein, partial [Planctomycetaceae bacterium]|nr:recombinase family protein [Planctomycetaceae bacterium]